MKNVTLSVHEGVLKAARQRAQQEGKSLNEVFREWIQDYACRGLHSNNFTRLMEDLSYAKSGGTWSRDERNER